MVETIEKATLLEKVQKAYEHLNALLATLNEEQIACLQAMGVRT